MNLVASSTRWLNISTDDKTERTIERYDLYHGEDFLLEIELLERDDWSDLSDPCPECTGTEFDHIQYDGGRYTHFDNTVIQQMDYWDQHGGLYTACRTCDEILHKSPAYDILEAVRTGEL